MKIRFTDIETGKMDLTFEEFKALAEKSKACYYGHFKISGNCTIYPEFTIEEDDWWENIFEELEELSDLLAGCDYVTDNAKGFKYCDKTVVLMFMFIWTPDPKEKFDCEWYYTEVFDDDELVPNLSTDENEILFDENVKFELDNVEAVHKDGKLQGFYYPKLDMFQEATW